MSQNAMSPPPWTTWWQTDLPSQFQPDQASKNARLLSDVLGADWLARRLGKPGAETHPIMRAWMSNGANAFFDLNALAEDLRIVRGVHGIDGVLRDLRRAELCLPTWHVIHVAALFARSEGQAVIEFLEQDDQTRPDFIVQAANETIAIEGKRFFPSRQQQEFEEFGGLLCDALLDDVFPQEGVQPLVVVVIKQPEFRPDRSVLLAAVRLALGKYTGATVALSSEQFNVFVEEMQPAPLGLSSYRGCVALSPRAVAENLRVQDRSKTASGQLQTLVDAGHSGILCLGLNEYQEAGTVAHLLNRRFGKGQYSAISSVLLIKPQVNLAPPRRCLVDLVSTVKNELSTVPLRSNLSLSSTGVMAPLKQESPNGDGIAAYRAARVTGVVSDPARVSLPAPDLQFLRPELLV
jgi:hypothetical protein